MHLSNGPDGKDMPVLLIPGFMTGDWSMKYLAQVLKSWNFAPARSGIRVNADCTFTVLDKLEARLEVVAERSKSHVALVGWSRGGTLGKLLATRRPDLVSGLITLASPNVDPLAVNPAIARQLGLLIRMNNVGVRSVMGAECITGDCAEAVGDAMALPFPAGVPYTSIFTRLDAMVDWRACLDPDARLVEVRSTHLSVGADPRVIRLVGNELVSFADRRITVPAARSGTNH